MSPNEKKPYKEVSQKEKIRYERELQNFLAKKLGNIEREK